jgi:tripartite-type tricarboxylate transporter receptor subunit TctC
VIHKVGRLAVILLASLTLAAGARAELYPTRSIRLVVPYTPGGITDIVARLVGQKLGERLGQPVVIDNRPGAGGNLAAELVVKSPPDGYTIFMGVNATQAIAPSLYPNLAFDPAKDFQPITLIASGPMVLMIHPSVPAQSVRELVALAKAKPNSLNFASSGNGGASHLSGALFKQVADIDIVHVRYKGTAPAVTDLLAGQVQLYFDPVITAKPNIESGKLRALAVTSATRSAALPDVPTMAEAGLPGVLFTTWLGILAPARTPPEIVALLHDRTVAVLREPEMQARMASQGLDIVADTPAEFAAFIASETTRMAKLVKESGAHVD